MLYRRYYANNQEDCMRQENPTTTVKRQLYLADAQEQCSYALEVPLLVSELCPVRAYLETDHLGN